MQFQTVSRAQHFPHIAMGIIASYFVEKLDGDAMFRRGYLRKMLVGPCLHPMPLVSFRRFSYFSNGQAGNISMNEDIIDHIIAYVV